jgi:ribosomal protein L29
MKSNEFKNKNDQELRQILSEKREKIREIAFSSSGGKAGDVKERSRVRKDIARILTILQENVSAKKSN